MDIAAATQGAVPADPATKARRILRNIGIICIALGLISTKSEGVAGTLFLLALGIAFLSPWALAKWQSLETRQEDLELAAQMSTGFQSERTPSPVNTPRLESHHQCLEPGESCYVDGAPATLYSFYGDPVLVQRGFFLAFGSPLAWAMTIIGNLMFWSHRRKKEKKAAARWRDPEPAQLWVTDRRFVLHALKGNQAWVQLRYDDVGFPLLEKDGIIFQLPELELPVKVRLRSPATVYVLFRYLSLRQIFNVELPWWSHTLRHLQSQGAGVGNG